MPRSHLDDQTLPEVPPATAGPRLVTADDSELGGGARALQLALAEAMRRPVGPSPRQRAARAMLHLAGWSGLLLAVAAGLGLLPR